MEDIKLIQLINKQNKKGLALRAADCAEHVLKVFQEKYPKDTRPQQAIEAARAWTRNEIKVGQARTAAFATHAAARETDDIAACAAARAAGHAAATAHMAGHAIHAANYALKAVIDKKKERERQYKHLQKVNDLLER